MTWSLGGPDGGPGQFADPLADPARPVVFVVGRDDPARDWPRFHPSPHDASNGWQETTYEIRFEAPEGPAAQGYELVIDAYANKGPCPLLRVELNGRTGSFILRPQRENRERVIEPMSPISGWLTLTVPVPADWLHDGQNVLRLTATSDETPDPVAASRRPQPFFANLFGTGFQYAGLALRPAQAAPVPLEVALIPLPLYVDLEGALHELVDLVVSTPLGSAGGHALLRFEDHEVKVDLPAVDLGQVRLRLPIVAFDAPQQVAVEVELGPMRVRHETTLRPCRQWTVHLLPHVHLDLGYTDSQGKVVELHTRNVDRALQIAATRGDYAFSLDGSFILDRYLASRSPDACEAALAALRRGQLSVQAFSLLFLTGLASLEECYRAAYTSSRLAQELDVPITYANLTDVPSYSWAVPSVLGELGIDSFLGVQNHARAANADSDVQHLVSPVRWEGPDGHAVTAFFADSYSGMRKVFSDPPTTSGGADGLVRYLDRYERDDYLPSDLPVVGSHADNEDLGDGESDFAERWNARYAFPKLRNSTIADYFAAIEPLRDQLPRYQGDGGSYWEDGVGTAARVMSTYRRAQGLLPAADALLALMATRQSQYAPPRAQLDGAWEALLLGCEHTWTAYHAVAHANSQESLDQTRWKTSQVEHAAQTARELADRAISQLGEAVSAEGPAVLVFNPSSWVRDLDVEVEIPSYQGISLPDGTGLPLHVVQDHDGLRRVRFRAAGVPSLGYRAFPLTVDVWAQVPPVVLASSDEVTTTRYSATVQDGRVVGLVDLASDRQLLDLESPYALGEVLYVSGGGTESGRGLDAERTTLADTDWCFPEPELVVLPASMAVHEVRRSPWGAEIELRGSAPSLDSVRVEIRLPDGDEPVEVLVDLDKSAVLAKESVYVAFPFAAKAPTVRYDRQQGWVDPSADHQPGACNEWFTTHNAVAFSTDDATVVWASADAPLFTVGDVVRGTWAREFEPRNGLLLSWVMNNYWFTNFPASQSGELSLRYAFRPLSGWDPVAAARFGREVRQPAVTALSRLLDKADWSRGPLPQNGLSLLRADLTDNVMATPLSGREGSLVVRLQEVGGRDGAAILAHPSGAAGTAWRCRATEERLEALRNDEGHIYVAVPAHGVRTVELAPPDPPQT